MQNKKNTKKNTYNFTTIQFLKINQKQYNLLNQQMFLFTHKPTYQLKKQTDIFTKQINKLTKISKQLGFTFKIIKKDVYDVKLTKSHFNNVTKFFHL